MSKDFSFVLDRFEGLSLPGTLERAMSEQFSPNMKNFCITKNGQLKLREGFQVLQRALGHVRCLWQGTLRDESLFLVLADEVLYRSPDRYRTLIEVGTIPGKEEVCCVEFRQKLYFLTGEQILVFDGEHVEELQPYRPLIRISTPPGGGGVPFEDVNLLTAKVRQSFSPNGIDNIFHLADSHVDSIDFVRYNAKELSQEQYTADPKRGEVHFLGLEGLDAPVEGTDTLEIGYTTSNHDPMSVHRCRFGLTYGGENDSRVFLYGNPRFPSMRFASGIADGVASMEYFPASSFSMVGDGEGITSIVRHYDRQIIFTPHSAYYSYPEVTTDPSGLQSTVFPVYTLSAMRGSIVHGLGLLVNNKPLSVMPDGLYLWTSTSIRDERNANLFSERIRTMLQKEDLRAARFFLRQATQELYVVLSRGICVYHYGRDLFYYYEGYRPTALIEDDDGTCFFATEDGKLCCLGGTTDDEEYIEAYWESSLLFCTSRTHTKNLTSITVGVDETQESPFLLECICDNTLTQVPFGSAAKPQKLIDLAQPDFSDFTFDSAKSKKEMRFRTCLKRFSHIRLRLTHPKSPHGLCISHLILRGKLNDQII